MGETGKLLAVLIIFQALLILIRGVQGYNLETTIDRAALYAQDLQDTALSSDQSLIYSQDTEYNPDTFDKSSMEVSLWKLLKYNFRFPDTEGSGTAIEQWSIYLISLVQIFIVAWQGLLIYQLIINKSNSG